MKRLNLEELISVDYKQMLKSGSYLWAVDSYGDGHIFDYQGNEYLKDKPFSCSVFIYGA